MLISKRRLRWLAITLLIACLLLLLRPTRLCIDRWIVAQVLGPQITVGELLIHSKHSLVEARQLSWAGPDENRRFQLTVHRGWIGYDQLGLVDRHTRLPKIILQSANLRLDPLVGHAHAVIDWKQHFAQQVSQFDWDQLENQLDCLIATRELKRIWSSNVKRWVSRSQQILAEAEQLERQTEPMDNPLRFELSLQEKFDSLRQLAIEHASLAKEFDKLGEQIDAETTRLGEVHGRDQIRLAGLVIGNTSSSTLDRQRTQLCNELAQALGEMFWQQTSCYGEVIDRVLQSSRDMERPSYDVNVRSNRHGNEWLVVTDWRASGQFSCGRLTTPYEACGNWLSTQETPGSRNLQFAWQATFQRKHAQIDVRAQHSSLRSTATQWTILQGPAGPDTNSTLVDVPASQLRSRIEVTSRHGKLQGTLALTAGSLSWLARELRQQLFDSDPSGALTAVDLEALQTLEALTTQASQSEPLQFQIVGTWSNASLQSTQGIPAWFSQAVTKAVDQRLQLATAANRQRLDQEFDHQVSELRKLVALALSDSRSLTVYHGQQLLAVQDRLHRQLTEMTGTEFARRPGAITR